ALVKHHRAVRPLVGIDPDQQRRRTSSSLAGGTPQRAILERSNARSCFEPHRSRHPAGGRFARKPTNGGRAFWRPPTGPRDATSTPARPHQIVIQGNLARKSEPEGSMRCPLVPRSGRQTICSLGELRADMTGGADMLVSHASPSGMARQNHTLGRRRCVMATTTKRAGVADEVLEAKEPVSVIAGPYGH